MAQDKSSLSKTGFPVDIMADSTNQEVSVDALMTASRLAAEMSEIEKTIAGFEKQIADKTDRYNKIQLELLPDLLLSIGIKEFSLSSGEKIEIKDFVRGSVPTLNQIEKAEEIDAEGLRARRFKAIAWLREVGAESIIKNQVIAEFGKGQDEMAQKFFDAITAEGYKVKKEEDINFQTLNSLLKSKIEEGVTVPAEPFGLFVGKKAHLKPAKKQ